MHKTHFNWKLLTMMKISVAATQQLQVKFRATLKRIYSLTLIKISQKLELYITNWIRVLQCQDYARLCSLDQLMHGEMWVTRQYSALNSQIHHTDYILNSNVICGN